MKYYVGSCILPSFLHIEVKVLCEGGVMGYMVKDFVIMHMQSMTEIGPGRVNCVISQSQSTQFCNPSNVFST